MRINRALLLSIKFQLFFQSYFDKPALGVVPSNLIIVFNTLGLVFFKYTIKIVTITELGHIKGIDKFALNLNGHNNKEN